MYKIFRFGIVFLVTLNCSHSLKLDYPIQPVEFFRVQLTDNFWSPRLETNRMVTIPYDFKKCEETGRIDNFSKAGKLLDGEFEGIRFNDSDVFKVIEGASYSLASHPDPELDQYLDNLIVKIAAAQEDDGYLYTTRTINPNKPAREAGDVRWSYLVHSHELYNVGHMYEAAVAHYQATGKKTLLNVAIKNADLICSVFGPGKRYDVPGHQEIEIGLFKLYRITGNNDYLDLAKFFLDQRGQSENHELYGEYCQDHIPVIEQDRPTGHAVRAAYMYSGMADAAALTGDPEYIHALNKIWQNTVYTKLYITGGIGSRYSGESFGEDYELPNLSAYNETCAAIANMLWNYRMFLLHGDAKYIDVFERTLYNGFLSGVSLDGNEFFYPNPLESDGYHKRSPWFDCACCPVNVARFLPSLPGYMYAVKNDTIYSNLFIASTAKLELPDNSLTIQQKSDYPWNGLINYTIDPEENKSFTLALRIPGWAINSPVPGDLYTFTDQRLLKPEISINNCFINYTIKNGYALITRTWQKGDSIDLYLQMPVRKIESNIKVKENENKIALQRGPLVYCVEWIDNNNQARNLVIPQDTHFISNARPELLKGIHILSGAAKTKNGQDQLLTAIPYYSWAHRGAGEMAVWIPYEN